MFDENFFPTPRHVIVEMLAGEEVQGKIILEPSAGKGDIVDFLLEEGAQTVLAVEPHPDLRAILERRCTLIGQDFMEISSSQISHIHMIVMNPPFSSQDEHILHAFEIAPAGCKIISLCNYTSYQNERYRTRRNLRQLVTDYGTIDSLNDCFTVAERVTRIEIGLVKLQKPTTGYEHEFEGFFMEDEQEAQENGLMPYNAVRDLVNRYVQAIKIYDRQLGTAQELHSIMNGYFNLELAKTVDEKTHRSDRNTFVKELQKSAWTFIFRKMNLEKYSTAGLKEDINKFVESQVKVPFTMRNVYRMLEIVIGTTTQRMDKALVEVFDRITQHHHENRYSVEGWQTNSHFLVNRKFILPGMCWQDQRWHKGESRIQTDVRGYWEFVEDLVKALCYISGERYESFGSLHDWIVYHYKTITDEEVFFHRRPDGWDGQAERVKALEKVGIACRALAYTPSYGEWFDWAYFRVKAFKKGTMHFEFLDLELWGRFNQRIARLKGYPLFEPKEQTEWQKRQTKRAA